MALSSRRHEPVWFNKIDFEHAIRLEQIRHRKVCVLLKLRLRDTEIGLSNRTATVFFSPTTSTDILRRFR